MKALIEGFAREVIHPHIFQEVNRHYCNTMEDDLLYIQEVTSLQFMYFLDSLRAYPARFLKSKEI